MTRVFSPSAVIQGTNKPCVRGSPPLQRASIILGDVFFHTYAAEFDMRLSTREHPATIGLAPVNPQYVIIPESTPIIQVEQAGQPLVRMHVHRDVDKLPIDNERGTQYFVQVRARLLVGLCVSVVLPEIDDVCAPGERRSP